MLEAKDELIEYYNYKEPLRKYEKGFGYMGVLAYHKKTGQVQCHICGEFFHALRPQHMEARHNITLKQYRDEVGLAYSTALCSEETRRKCVRRQAVTWLSSIDRLKQITITIANNKKRKGEKLRLEKRNLRGNCPDQLLDKIKRLRDEIGRVPTKKDWRAKYKSRFLGTIYEIFGTWVAAVKAAGLIPVSITERENVQPERLLQYLKDFYKRFGRTLQCSDMRRGYAPDFHTYRKHFKTINEARMAASVPILIPQGRGKYFETMDYSLLNK